MSKRTIVLIILDGWGMGQSNESNPIHVVNPQNINYLKANFPSGTLQASGISVGLPWGEEGNSEVGHLNLGAGKIIYQNYPRISLAIHDKSFFENSALKGAFEHAKKNNSIVNLVGLLSEGNVHSSFKHLLALIDFAKKLRRSDLPPEVGAPTEASGEGVKINPHTKNFGVGVNLHLFTDGRDSRPNSALELLNRLPKESFVNLASLSGRFYAMDREGHWERTQKAYSVLVGEGSATENIEMHIKKTYERKFSDEFVEPIRLIGPMGLTRLPDGQVGHIKDNDSIIFFNFREDRIRQLSSAFINPQFKNFPTKSLNNLYIVTMTQYDDEFKVPVAFPPEKIETCLGKILADNGKNQLRIAETQKYPHITYFLNGMREEPFKNEYRVLIPSKTVIRQEERPEMMASEITTRIVESIGENAFDFILANYANSDMIAHTGNYEACLKAVKAIDEQIGKITKVVLESNAVLIITSDHGNIERVFNPLTGEPETQHDPNPVPIYLVAKEYMRQKTETEIKQSEKESIGVLADITPTILELIGIPKPKEMSGQSLLKSLINL